MRVQARKYVLDKGFKITRTYILANKVSNRGKLIKELRKHGCTLRKNGDIYDSRGQNLVTLTDGTVQRLGIWKDRVSYTTREGNNG